MHPNCKDTMPEKGCGESQHFHNTTAAEVSRVIWWYEITVCQRRYLHILQTLFIGTAKLSAHVSDTESIHPSISYKCEHVILLIDVVGRRAIMALEEHFYD